MEVNNIELLKKSIIRGIDIQSLDLLSDLFAQWTKHQGFKCSWDNIPEKLMLIVTEASEAMEAYRNNDRDNFNEELADIFIRLLDMCGGLEVNIQLEVKAKMIKNFDRPYKHGRDC